MPWWPPVVSFVKYLFKELQVLVSLISKSEASCLDVAVQASVDQTSVSRYADFFLFGMADVLYGQHT